MFTGIIEEIGKIKNITAGTNSGSVCISASTILNDLNIGDSICVNGVCLTVNSYNNNSFIADIMMSTIRATNFSEMKIGDKVNLERAMSLNKRFGGHIVTGHVDITGIIKEIKKEENATWLTIKVNEQFMKHVLNKGSICIDGVSLTVGRINVDNFSVSIIPHTKEKTILLNKKVNEKVNLEGDIIGKYVNNFLNMEKNNKTIDMNFLMSNGF
ncbi:MAG: riboflavin synthase [Clostridium sp.]|uniref:riboflavin synthase n=1 Tax=Clostridium sp. TaxID=1506 RepID=UPI003F35B087